MVQNIQTVDNHEIEQIRDGALKMTINSTIYSIWIDIEVTVDSPKLYSI